MPPPRRSRGGGGGRLSFANLMFIILLCSTMLLLGHVYLRIKERGHMPHGILFRLFVKAMNRGQQPAPEPTLVMQDLVPQKSNTEPEEEEEYPAEEEVVLTDEAVREQLQELYKKSVPILLDRTALRSAKEISCGGSHVVKFQTYGDLKGVRGLDQVLPDRDMFLAARKAKIFKKCAVVRPAEHALHMIMGERAQVGNSGSLLESMHGPAIDAHDMVIRFNAGITDGYEQFVGQKTTFRILNNWDSAPKEAGEVTISTIRNYEVKNWVQSIRSNKGRLNSAFAVDPEFLCHAWEWVGNRGHKPSSGVVGIVLALKVCDKVRTYGFQSQNYFSKTSRPHYYDWERPAKGREKVHPFHKEMVLYKHLVQLGMLEIIE